MGNQEPRIKVEPDGVAYTDGPDAAALCTRYWFEPDPWQRMLLDCWLGRDENGVLRVISAGIACPRQNGKNGAIEALEFYLLVTDPDTHILHTAHSTKTAQKAFERMCRVFNSRAKKNRAIHALVEKANGGRIRYTNGEQAIYLSNGASIEYATRTGSGGRGFDSISLLVYDECQQLTDDQVQAVMATLAASKGDRLIIYAGTPPNENAPGVVFERRRDAAINNPNDRTSWHEWSIPALPPEDSTFEDLLDLVYETNPAMGLRLSEDFTAQEFIDMDFTGFCQERLGWWQESAVPDPAIDYGGWQKCATDNPTKATRRVKRAIGIKFSPDGSQVAVTNAIVTPGRLPHLELMTYANISSTGVEPLAEALYRIRNKVALVVIDGMSNADALMGKLKEMGYPPKGYARMAPKDAISAATMLVNATREKSLTHYDQEALNDSVRTAIKRPIGAYGGYGFGGVSPEPVESAAAALWALKTTKRNPTRRMRLL